MNLIHNHLHTSRVPYIMCMYMYFIHPVSINGKCRCIKKRIKKTQIHKNSFGKFRTLCCTCNFFFFHFFLQQVLLAICIYSLDFVFCYFNVIQCTYLDWNQCIFVTIVELKVTLALLINWNCNMCRDYRFNNSGH